MQPWLLSRKILPFPKWIHFHFLSGSSPCSSLNKVLGQLFVYTAFYDRIPGPSDYLYMYLPLGSVHNFSEAFQYEVGIIHLKSCSRNAENHCNRCGHAPFFVVCSGPCAGWPGPREGWPAQGLGSGRDPEAGDGIVLQATNPGFRLRFGLCVVGQVT